MRATSNPLSLAIAMAMMGTITVSQAQDLGLQEAENEVKTSSSGVLEEVIVTAAKVEASIQDTPIAVSAFSQDQLDSQLILTKRRNRDRGILNRCLDLGRGNDHLLQHA